MICVVKEKLIFGSCIKTETQIAFAFLINSGNIKKDRDKMVCSDGGGVCLCLNPAQQLR